MVASRPPRREWSRLSSIREAGATPPGSALGRKVTEPRLLVIGAHAADYVWRSAGAIALTAAEGGEVMAVALSCGARGESGALWAEEGQTLENVRAVRHAEAARAASILDAEFRCLHLDDYPLIVSPEHLMQLADLVRDFEPTLIITHSERDPLNPDHPEAHRSAIRAEQLATGAGRSAAFKTIPQPEVLLFEPHYPDLSGFEPDVYLDITSVETKKVEAMAAMESQRYMPAYQELRMRQRAWQARRIGARSDIESAEVFQRYTPQVVNRL